MCARDEEAEAVEKIIEKRVGAKFAFSSVEGEVPVKHATCSIDSGPGPVNSTQVTFWLTYPLDQGGSFAADWISRLLSDKRFADSNLPDLFLMTGVCAGRRGDCQLGDLMVAKKAFNYQAGKISDKGHAPVPEPFGPLDDTFVQTLEMSLKRSKAWHLPEEEYPVSRPDTVLRYLYERALPEAEQSKEWFEATKLSSAGVLLNKELKTRFPEWNKILANLTLAGEILETEDGYGVADKAKARIKRGLKLHGEFPQKEPREPDAIFGIWGSGASVRADTGPRGRVVFEGREVEVDGSSAVFDECRKQHRNTVAVDMEAETFYHMLHIRGVKCLVVKGVSDHADSKKDDTFHEYGKLLAAAFALEVVKHVISGNKQ